MALVGPNGAAVLHLFAGRRLAVGADAKVLVQLKDTGGTPISLASSIYDTYTGAGRRERNEVLTTAPLFAVSAALTSVADGGDGTGADGKLTLTVDGAQLGQDTPQRGYFDLFASLAATPTKQTLLITGRWECVGGTVDPITPTPA